MELKDLYSIYLQNPSVKTDTRQLAKGDIFIALNGPNFNGNHFVKEALDKGASYVVIDEGDDLNDLRIIKTGNSLLTLQNLAGHHREQFKKMHGGSGIPFLAITGSNGKTTTKELISRVLSTTYKTYSTDGNLNNHIGIPVTILKIKNDAEIAVIEMGANHVREIEGYCTYAMPTHGIITNIGKAHLEGFGSIQMVRKAKGELFEYLKKNSGTAIVNTDDPNVLELSNDISKIFTYGTKNAEVTGRANNNDSFLYVAITKSLSISTIGTQLIGKYNLSNVLSAIAVGRIFNVPEEKIKQAIESYSPGNSRSQLIKKGSNTIILDAYNANPSSMKAAIENFEMMPGSNKILMLGAMMELGSESKHEHQQIIDLVDRYHWKQVVLVGDNFKEVKHHYKYFDSSSALRDWFIRQHVENATILIKGSRNVQMEKVLEV
jgi:UDP-N-acetylmuramoyl-tripeptide--D-alanyl-D-alanine ligase